MELKNTTHWDERFLRRMVAWVCKQVEYPKELLRVVEFGKRSEHAFNGRAWLTERRIRVVIGPADYYPTRPTLYPGRTSEVYCSPGYQDQLEALVGVTAHEVEHLFSYRYRQGNRKRSERYTRIAERRIIELFRKNREALLAAWSKTLVAVSQ